MPREFDLRDAINAISDIVMNRPPPIREFDQIYMKVADMVIHAHYVSKQLKDKNVVFVGDGDAIALAVLYLSKLKIFQAGPTSITLLDFDQRILNSVARFAEKHGFQDQVATVLYNVIDPLPQQYLAAFDAFHINPPWGKSNGGESVNVFLERGIEACSCKDAEGIMVIADDPGRWWTREVLGNSQRLANHSGYYVAELIPQLHLYHLEDAPDLRSCMCLFRRFDERERSPESLPFSSERRHNFYGRKNPLKIQYIQENADLNHGKASDATYELVRIEE